MAFCLLDYTVDFGFAKAQFGGNFADGLALFLERDDVDLLL